MREIQFLPHEVNVQARRHLCPNYQDYMMLTRIVPARMGYDFRTFECPLCDYVHEIIVANDAFGSPFVPVV